MFYADTVGLPTVLARVKEYRARFGDYWKPAPLLERLVAEGRGFYSGSDHSRELRPRVIERPDADDRSPTLSAARSVGRKSPSATGSKCPQARIDRFADATDDHQWIHVDRARAAAIRPSRRPSRTGS